MKKPLNQKTYEKYIWWRDKKMLGTLILISSILFIVFTFINVKFISSINAYTIGMLVGFYSPLIYIYVIFISLKMIFGNKIHIPKWIKFNSNYYWILVGIIIFISSSSGYYQSKIGFTAIGAKPWSAFDIWFKNFTDNSKTSAWFPGQTNGGLLGVFSYSLVASMLSGIGAIIVSISLLVISVSIIITGSSINFYKKILNQKVHVKKSKSRSIQNVLLTENEKKENIQNESIQNEKNESIQNESIQNESIQNESIQNESIQNESIQNESIQNEPPIQNKENKNIEIGSIQNKTSTENFKVIEEKEIKNEKVNDENKKDDFLPFDDPF